MGESHLELIQPEDWTRPNAPSRNRAPLFLMHDGGGTTFMYNFLPALGRFVYGIRNPHFSTGEIFSGGVSEMGRLYARWIHDTVARTSFPARRNPNEDKGVDIILGGWSFGGLLSLEVAKQLDNYTGVRVVGILAVDSIYPSEAATAAPTPPPPGSASDGDGREKTRNQVLSERAMEEARCMVRMWTVPVWEGPESRRPRVVLLKAKGYIPSTSGSVSPLDLDRGPGGRLGWDQHDEAMFEEVIEVEGHHFELFSGGRIEGTGRAMRQALDELDTP
ncbi:hypothetical protein ACRE_034560 [Hapsidospora chrysogenum ATCC 11550]|uniref:AB hydrolase-1 domain-containing protein n=1 Tax=Hapsidospora chrysogenum (strain ATCC 11550 / CBS 779.69 / DSM 880 / IAM 14645 / JCM 23072 / IMI 49137) TaxID=857340 RepID=A0A086T8P9_HAPC1|nr:hypothetical protein ACRE_034560 [Hapsidospora chrysogenum ATCC 11550]